MHPCQCWTQLCWSPFDSWGSSFGAQSGGCRSPRGFGTHSYVSAPLFERHGAPRGGSVQTAVCIVLLCVRACLCMRVFVRPQVRARARGSLVQRCCPAEHSRTRARYSSLSLALGGRLTWGGGRVGSWEGFREEAAVFPWEGEALARADRA